MLLRRYHQADAGEPDAVEDVESVEAEPAEPEIAPAWPDGEPTEKWRTAEIEAYAEAHGVDLTGASNKAEKVERIRAHATN